MFDDVKYFCSYFTISTLNELFIEHLDILVVLVVKRSPGKQQGYVVIHATLGTIKIV
jgi:hypothetical protein